MPKTQYRNVWLWLAVAAMAIATLARAEAGYRSTAAYANPVIQFLAAHPNSGTLTATGIPRFLKDWSARQNKSELHGGRTGVWQAMLPVLFIGLVAPLNLISLTFRSSLDRAPAAPALPSLFQRPPPAQLV